MDLTKPDMPTGIFLDGSAARERKPGAQAAHLYARARGTMLKNVETPPAIGFSAAGARLTRITTNSASAMLGGKTPNPLVSDCSDNGEDAYEQRVRDAWRG